MNTRKFRLRIPVHALTGISIALLAMPALADTNEELQILRQQLEEQRAKSIILEQRINELASASAKAKAPETVSSVTAGYDEGFYVKDASGNHSLRINGLLQPRYTYFKTSDVQQLGGTESNTSSFDIFLGRLYFSGSVADPSIGYWFTLQGGTSDGMTLLDAELSKTFSPYLTIEMGKYWSAYTYQYTWISASICFLTFPSLSGHSPWADRQVSVPQARLENWPTAYRYRIRLLVLT